MKLHIANTQAEQPLLAVSASRQLTVAIATLAIGGAEQMVLDWAIRIHPLGWNVHIIVLRDQEKEWRVPSFIEVTRLHGTDIRAKLTSLGKKLAASSSSVCLCHLLKKDERDALSAHGATIVPVLQNARDGWIEEASRLESSPYAITVSEACQADLRACGSVLPVSVIRHIPRLRSVPGNRERFRKAWNIPQDATVIGMIGAVKPQKNYPFALNVLHALQGMKDTYLVIVGGPIGRDGRSSWEALIAEIDRLGLRSRVAMPGFIPDASQCLSVFDLFLNTSHYEGLSVATLEALMQRLPVVASKVGGQGEIGHEGLTLMDPKASAEVWATEIARSLSSVFPAPSWSNFPSYRLWTLASLARPVLTTGKVLFVTANLNSGGAQRSLVNLVTRLNKKLRLEVAVTGNSTASHFFKELSGSGVIVRRTAATRDPFDHAEALVQKISNDQIGTVCFWNLDPKVKLLVMKSLEFTSVRFVDVSPGRSSFEELQIVAEFQRMICFDENRFHARLDNMVLKYDGESPIACARKTVVIPNGIPVHSAPKMDYTIRGNPRVVVNGRIAPTKFFLEILEAMKIVRERIPDVELHVFGAAEPRFETYAASVEKVSKEAPARRIFFHGPSFDTVQQLPEFDVFVVLGKHQGCPNALLEALSAGLPCIANDDGGTREQIIHGETGLLLENESPNMLAEAIVSVLIDRDLARELGQNGRAHIEQSFGMDCMVQTYFKLLRSESFLESLVSKLSRMWKSVTTTAVNQKKILDYENPNTTTAQ